MLQKSHLGPGFVRALALAFGLVAVLPKPGYGQNALCPGPIAVTVRSQADGKPVAGLVVKLGARYAATGANGDALFDGVPAGTHRLAIAQAGFDRLERDLTVPAGKRAAVDLVLVPERRVRVEGQVTVEGLGAPLAGARLTLVPDTVPAGIRGSLAFTTDWDGKFVALGVPAGGYRAELRASGCVAKTFSVAIGQDPRPLAFTLERTREPAALAVRVQDSDGKPVPGAEVVLAEAFPRGEIRRGRAGADGSLAFADLSVAQVNFANAEGRVAASRRQVTLHAEAPGHAPMTIPVVLSSAASATVVLFPARVVTEQEPNDTIATAQAIDVGATLRYRIPAQNDQDWFKFRLPQPGRLRMVIAADATCQTWFEVVDPRGKVLASQGAYAGGANVFDLPFEAGEYFLHLSEWGNDDKSDRVLEVSFTYTAMPDPLAPNGQPEVARTIRPNEEVRGYFLAARDAECYRFVLDRPTTVRVSVSAEPFQRRVELRHQGGLATGDSVAVYPGAPLALVAHLRAGEYVLVATEWGQDQSPMAPATIRLEAIADDGWNDDPRRSIPLASARTLEADGLVGSTILPLGDVDLYAVALPSSGTLRVDCTFPHQQEVRVLTRDGQVLAVSRAYPNGTLAVDCPIERAQTVFVEVSEWASDEFTMNPYVLRTAWCPCEEAEAQGRDDSFATAAPFEAGDDLRGTFAPLGDQDCWRFDADRAGRLELAIVSLGQIQVQVCDRIGKELGIWNSYGGSTKVWASVPPGEIYVVAREWGNDAWSPAAYSIRTRLLRVDPDETVPLRDDAVRELRLGEARPFKPEHLKDRDRFLVSLPTAGKYWLQRSAGFQTEIVGRDALLGTELFRLRNYPGEVRHEFEVKGPTRLLLEATEWADDDCSMDDGLMIVAAAGLSLCAERLLVTLDRCDPTLVTFARAEWKGLARAVRAGLDVDADGRVDLPWPADTQLTYRYPAEGVHAARLVLESADGTRSLVTAWVEALGHREKKGVRLVVGSPRAGECIESQGPLLAMATSYSGARIARVDALVDGRACGSGFTAPYVVDVPWDSFGPGEHTLTVIATDARNDRATIERKFTVSEFFGLAPHDAAQVTGEEVHVAWSGRSFGPGAVRVRKAGEQTWTKTVLGQNGRVRRVALTDLEPGAAYEFQPVADQEGPVRTVTRVKGLAFGRSKYAATVKRDYDQKVAVSVRNHGEKAQQVRLECGEPPAASRLLAGFVGEGSQGAPFALQPGEERDFLLGVSAQDCVARRVAVPIRLVPLDAGATDTALVELDVQLPNVALEWVTKGDVPGGLGKVMTLRNKGDTLTDLAVRSLTPDLIVSPALEHAMFPAGQTLEFRATPRLFEGFRAVESAIVASSVDKTVESPQKLALAVGESIHAVDLAARSEDPVIAERENLAALAAAHLNPASVDWSKRANPQDTNDDGKPDRWTVDHRSESTRWIGVDHDGDGQIDLAQADVGLDGVVDFCAIKDKDGWQETNLVESWLELGFKLPWARSAYEKHDADIVVNDTVVGRLRDTIPEGNYSFRVPPPALKFGADGSPSRNEVRIESKHLRGGHYVVSSDFRMKLALTGTRVYSAAQSKEAAKRAILATPGLTLGKPDLSLSSQEMRVRFQGEAKGGTPMTVSAPLRNVGSGPARHVEVALRFGSAAGDVELARTQIPLVPASGVVQLELTALAPAGDHTLVLAVDPDQQLPDSDRGNHEARAPIKTTGDATKPTLTVQAPANGASLAEPVVALAAKAEDGGGVARAEVRVDRGLWQRLASEASGYTGKALLQPGPHTLTFRALDTSGNPTEQTVSVTVTAKRPSVEIVEPAAGAKLGEPKNDVVVRCGDNVAAVGVRVNGGPWQRGELVGATARVPMRVPFGAAKLEAMAVDRSGVRALADRSVECTRQPLASEEPVTQPSGRSDPIDVAGLGKIDPFGPESPVLSGQGAQPSPERGAPAGQGPGQPPGQGGAAETEAVPDEPGVDGSYGSALPEGMDPLELDDLEAAEQELLGAEGDDELMDGSEWLDDPTVDRTEDPDLKDPEVMEDPDWQPPDFEDWTDAPVDPDAPDGGDDIPGEGGLDPLPAPVGAGESGAYVGVQQQQADWYCTNRPTVGVGFQLPDWLKKLALPKPGTKEFEEAFAKQLAMLRARGIDTSKLEQLRTILRNRCNRLDSPEELPDFLQSLGFKPPTTRDPEALARWREAMANSADSFMLRLLHSGDPRLIAEGLQARLSALSKFDEACQDSAQAAIETIKANQKITEDFAMVVPYLNIALSARGLVTGETLGGDKLSTFERALHALGVVGPAMSLLKNPTLRNIAAQVGNKAMWLGENTIGRLAARLGVSGARLKEALRSLADALGNARIAAGERIFGKVWGAEQRFLRSAAGRQAAELAKQDLRQAQSLLFKIAQARAAGDKQTYRKLIGLLQGNKTAQGLLNSGGYSNTFRAALDTTHRAMGRLADKKTIAELMRNPNVRNQIDKLARKVGIDAADIVVKARNVSGNIKRLKDLKPGELLKYGADRDVVYQFVSKQGKTLADLHHKIVEPIYARNLKRIAGRSLYEMDHVVTSRWHPEAYNAGLNPNTKAGQQAIADIISGKAAGRLGRPTDIRDTVVHKGKEWMEAGELIASRGRPALGNQKIREGMRQMLKEYDRQVAQFVKAKGLDPARALPPRLREGLEIFKKVRDGAPNGSFTVEQAKKMLESLTVPGGRPVTPQTIAEDLGVFVEFLNKWGLRRTG